MLTIKEKEPKNAEAVIKDIRRRTKRKFGSKEKILKQREEVKQKTILQKRINHLFQNQSLSFV